MLNRTLFDPPSDPEGGARVCLYCDQTLEKERFTDEWVCVNRRCEQSPDYDMIFDAHEGAAEWARDLLKRNPADWVILDTETTGLSNKDQVVQVAMIDGAGNALINNVLVKPTIRIPAGISEIHHITDELVLRAPSFLEVWPEIYKYMQGKRLVIYNAEFDLRMLIQSADAHSNTAIAFPCCSWHCAMEMYAAWVGDWNDYHGNFRWQRLPGGDHTALGDCRATLEVIRKMAGE